MYTYAVVDLRVLVRFCSCLVVVVVVVLLSITNDLIILHKIGMRMATAPLIYTFNSRTDDWNLWSRRFKQWLTLSPYAMGDNAEAKQHAALCTYIDSPTFKLLCSLCAPKKPEELTFAQLKAKLDGQ